MSEDHHYDLVVVGGGPAGSSAATIAAKNGMKVALLEKESSIAETVRTSGVTWIQNIKEFGIPDDCFNPIKNFSFCSPNNEVTISDTVSRAAVLDVRKTYRWLAHEAENAGADIFIKISILNTLVFSSVSIRIIFEESSDIKNQEIENKRIFSINRRVAKKHQK